MDDEYVQGQANALRHHELRGDSKCPSLLCGQICMEKDLSTFLAYGRCCIPYCYSVLYTIYGGSCLN